MFLGALNDAVPFGVSGLMSFRVRLFASSVNLDSIVINDEPLSDCNVGLAIEPLLGLSIAVYASRDTESTSMDVRRA